MNNNFPRITLVFDRYSKASPTKKGTVEVRISYNKKQKYISTGIRLYSNQWKKGTVVNTPDELQLNQTLDTILRKVRQAIIDMMDENKLDIFAIPERIKQGNKYSHPFIKYCKERYSIKIHGKAKGSQRHYKTFIENFEKWGKIAHFKDITEANILAYDKHLEELGMKPVSRWGNYHKYLNLFIIDAINNGLVTRNPYKGINIDKGKNSNGIEKHLTTTEFQQLKEAQMSTESLTRVRDMFVFQTYTCLSYSDLAEFDIAKIHEVNGMQVYIGSRVKTDKPFTIPILTPAWNILMKYNGKLPIISNVKYNLYLKAVAQEAKIDKPISSHWARHTGATLLLNEGIPMQIVSKICGHSSIRITEQIYAKLLDETVVKAMAALEGEEDN